MLIRRPFELREIHGIQIAREDLMLSLFFFMDNSVFFSWACDIENRQQVEILRRYNRASGQVVNFEKSMLFFSGNVEVEKHQPISDVFRIIRIMEESIYLGFPPLIGRSKV